MTECAAINLCSYYFLGMFWASGPMLHPVKPPRNHHDPARQYEVVLMIHRLPTKLLTIVYPPPFFQRRSMSLPPNHAQMNPKPPSLHRLRKESNRSPQENPRPRSLSSTPMTKKKTQKEITPKKTCPRRLLFTPQDWKRNPIPTGATKHNRVKELFAGRKRNTL